MRRVLCLGMSALDENYQLPVIPTVPTKVLATGFTECGGGMAANASVAVARLAGAAAYWGRVGDDALGTRLCARRRNNDRAVQPVPLQARLHLLGYGATMNPRG